MLYIPTGYSRICSACTHWRSPSLEPTWSKRWNLITSWWKIWLTQRVQRHWKGIILKRFGTGRDVEVKKGNGSSSMSTMIENMSCERTRIREAIPRKLPEKRPKVRHTASYCAQRNPRWTVVHKYVYANRVPKNVTDGEQVWANCAAQNWNHVTNLVIFDSPASDKLRLRTVLQWTVAGDETKG
jgi:hypothetical protein